MPKSPGIYLYFNKLDNLLYIGKAKNLKNRVASYFSGPLLPKTELIVSQIDHIRYLITESEIDALLLEAEVIRNLQPKYNNELKDNKSYPRVKIINSIISVVHNENDPEAKYFGPYPDSGKIRLIIRQIRKIFPYYSEKHKPGQICFRGHLKLCPCTTQTNNIKEIIKILTGKRIKLIDDLNKEMKLYSKLQNFEEALKLKNQIDLLTSLGVPTHQPWEYQTNPNISAEININKIKILCDLLIIKYKENFRIEGYDISHISGTDVVGSMVVFIDGGKNTNEYRRFKIKIDQNDDTLVMNEVLARRFNHPEWPFPDLILVDGPPRHSGQSPESVIIVGLEKKQETIVLANGAKINLPKSNLGLQLLMAVRDESHRFAQNYHHVLRRKKMVE